MQYNTLARFAVWRLTESHPHACHARGWCGHRRCQKEVELESERSRVKGTLDVIIRDETGH